jgi:hypothetical protein
MLKMRIKKKDLQEAKFIVNPDDYDKIKDDVTADDTVTVIDEDGNEVVEEGNYKAIIKKGDLINFIKENKG